MQSLHAVAVCRLCILRMQELQSALARALKNRHL